MPWIFYATRNFAILKVLNIMLNSPIRDHTTKTDIYHHLKTKLSIFLRVSVWGILKLFPTKNEQIIIPANPSIEYNFYAKSKYPKSIM